MFSRSTWLHLRIPFSFFLMPVYLFALSISSNLGENRIIWSFIIIHVLLYPASNGYNSYFDKDEKSIGGLKNPPPVKRGLYWTALIFDIVAILLGALKINLTFAVMLFIYGIVSKAYSHPITRLKKYPVTGWFTAGIFQGFFTFLMAYIGINDFTIDTLSNKVIIGAALSSIMLWGSYPMTQIYQHEEDRKRGDRTLSLMLGVRGTFIFVQIIFGLAAAGFLIYFMKFYSVKLGVAFVLALIPVMTFFTNWMLVVWKNEARADFSNTMRLNLISSLCLSGFFLYVFMSTTHILQYFRG